MDQRKVEFVRVDWKDPDRADSILEQDIREMVNRQVEPVTYPADTLSGVDLDHYDFDDPEQLISDILHYIKLNFRWKKKPKEDGPKK